VVDVRITGGGPPVSGTASSFEVTSVLEVSVPIPAVLRGRKVSGDDFLGEGDV
jgi:hypothetical protein